ncbi:DNA-binding domain-containing protein [Brevundimonas sp.]|uniref:HvfC/BufC N-terminal domain-containing protein n=1 Tax=Brevundimonas sp. TaxID=1871086 RepID=UPI0025EEAE82|nr:DNA-binding domain-containing protein [Brevundimonas sp.]
MTAFHADFERALRGDREAMAPHLGEAEDGLIRLGVYANTSAAGRIDALAANYPTVVRMVGLEWFQAAAAAFVRSEPGSSAVLIDYGQAFADWLGQFGPARAYPYLAPCARLDRAWTEAHVAPDAARRAAPEDEDLVLHPSVRIFAFDWNAPSLWLAHRLPQEGQAAELEWRLAQERILIHRPDLAVTAQLLSNAEWSLLKAAGRGLTLFQAVMACAPLVTREDLTRAARDLIDLGAFVPRPQGDPHR